VWRAQLYAFFNHGAKWGSFVNATLRSLYPGNDPIPILQDPGSVPGSLWAGAEIVDPIRNLSQVCPACNESLYQLRYPGLRIRNWSSYKAVKIILDTKSVQLGSKLNNREYIT
jgi:hypothetical protein